MQSKYKKLQRNGGGGGQGKELLESGGGGDPLKEIQDLSWVNAHIYSSNHSLRIVFFKSLCKREALQRHGELSLPYLKFESSG